VQEQNKFFETLQKKVEQSIRAADLDDVGGLDPEEFQ